MGPVGKPFTQEQNTSSWKYLRRKISCSITRTRRCVRQILYVHRQRPRYMDTQPYAGGRARLMWKPLGNDKGLRIVDGGLQAARNNNAALDIDLSRNGNGWKAL